MNVIGLKNVRQIRYIVIRYNYKTRYSILDLYTFQKIKEFIFFFLIHWGQVNMLPLVTHTNKRQIWFLSDEKMHTCNRSYFRGNGMHPHEPPLYRAHVVLHLHHQAWPRLGSRAGQPSSRGLRGRHLAGRRRGGPAWPLSGAATAPEPPALQPCPGGIAPAPYLASA